MVILPLSKATLAVIQTKIDEKTKPLGALGALEPLAVQLALISEQRRKKHAELISRSSADKGSGQISMNMPTMLVFTGDHGINEENLSIAPSDVTQQILLNFLQGGAAINCFCQSNELALRVIDCGILQAINPNDIAQLL